MEGALRIIDRGAIFAAARHALSLHQWLTEPDFDQEGEVKRAEAVLAQQVQRMTPLLAAVAFHAWIERGGERAPMRAAGHWVRCRLLRLPVPLTGAAALRAEAPGAPNRWMPVFLNALAEEADDARQLLCDLERGWRAGSGARSPAGGATRGPRPRSI